MSEPHRIRLRGPWEVTGLAPVLPPKRMTIPCSWREGGWPGFIGQARHVRLFGLPRLRQPEERVLLNIDQVTGEGQVQLNGQALGAVAVAFRHDVTELLQSRNRLEIVVTSDSDAGGVTGEVSIEIVSA